MQHPAYLIDRDLSVGAGFFFEEGVFGKEVTGGVFEEKELDPAKLGIKKVIMPSFFNSHVHLMDSITIAPKISLEDLVGPEGYKFRAISSVKKEELVEASKEAISHAFTNGTTGFADFRELGLRGLEILKEADVLGVVLPLARPESVEEAEAISKEGFAKGFGMSSVRDHEFGFLEELREFARQKGLLFGIHAGERDDEDVEEAFSLEPDFIVHMNKASKKYLKKAMDSGIPIISCFRSNFFFGLGNLKNYSILAEYNNWGIGTDNAMIATPSLLDEVNFASYFLDSENLLRAAFFGFDLFDVGHRWVVLESSKVIRNAKPIEHVARGFCRVRGVLDRLKIE
ncbi:MAG: amidohydrolase family protein [Archaeoglobus sp.]|nr:amidohydrolase family protein [Archaeoglobus sp.]